MQINNTINPSLLAVNEHKKGAETSLEKISSGKSIQLSDAALALIANAIGSDISVLGQGVENANIATSLLQIADGTLSGLSQGADDLNVLAMKSNNPALNAEQQNILKNEASALAESLQNSIDNTSYNGQAVFGKNFDFNLGNSSISVALGVFDLGSYDLYSQEGIADFMKDIQASQIEAGSSLNELASTTNSIYTQIASLSTAKSEISDTDIAKEFLKFEQNSIQLKASLMMQAHSNEVSIQNVARLLA